MSEAPRRAFLRQLVTLPLIGGGLNLIGQPTAVAEPVTMDLLEAYKTWLHYEHRSVAWEMAELPDDCRLLRRDACRTLQDHGRHDPAHRRRRCRQLPPLRRLVPASHRAALVLSTVGCDWHDDEARYAKRRA